MIIFFPNVPGEGTYDIVLHCSVIYYYWKSYCESCLIVLELSLCSSPPSKKIQKKVPKRVHKAEREKLKREHLNELFLDLANALGNFLSANDLFFLFGKFQKWPTLSIFKSESAD